MRVEFGKFIDFPTIVHMNNKQLTLTRFSFMSIGYAIVQRYFTQVCFFNNIYFMHDYKQINDKIVGT